MQAFFFEAITAVRSYKFPHWKAKKVGEIADVWCIACRFLSGGLPAGRMFGLADGCPERGSARLSGGCGVKGGVGRLEQDPDGERGNGRV
jgi:hypothetical protein